MTKTERDLLVAIGETLSAFAHWAREEHEHKAAFRKTTRELNAALIAVAEEQTEIVCDYCQETNGPKQCPR